MSPIMRMTIDLTADVSMSCPLVPEMKVVARNAVTIGVRTDTTGSGSHTQDLVMNLSKAMIRDLLPAGG